MTRLSLKSLLIIVVLLLVGIVGLWQIQRRARPAAAGWFNDAWQYRKTINIGYTGATTNVQIKILNNYDLSALVTAGKLQADLDDLRFTDINGNLLSFWIEDTTNNSADVWAILPSVSTSGNTIYMYYGNPSAISASNSANLTIGGTMTSINGYRIHTFKSSGTLTNKINTSVDYLAVAGGGGGGSSGVTYCGGGGAGGLLTGTTTVNTGNITVTVGVGGDPGSNGANSVFNSIITYGGGAGQCAAVSSVGFSGGSGGGGTAPDGPGGAGVTGQGNSGGLSSSTTANAGGGGGGAGSGGAFTGANSHTNSPQAGGNGVQNSLSGSSQWYAAGGSSGAWYYGSRKNNIGGANLGNIPISPYNNWYVQDESVLNGTENTGSGGGGGSHISGVGGSSSGNGGYGGSGIVIVRYISAIASSLSTTEEVSQAPVAYWSFDEGVGTTAYDSSSNRNNGIISSATWQTEDMCVTSKCLKFGPSSKVTVTSNKYLFSSGDFSVSVWVKPTALNGYDGIITTDAPSEDTAWKITREIGTSNFVARYAGSSISFGNATINQWALYSFVKIGTTITTYVNGSRINTGSVPSTNSGTYGYLGLGTYRANENDHYFEGFIDEPKIYAYARTATQIKQDYRAGLSGMKSQKGVNVAAGGKSAKNLSDGLVGYWKMDEGVGTTTADSSGNSNTGTLTGTIWSSGKYGIGASFNGTSDYIDCGTSPTLINTTNMAFSFWLKTSDASKALIAKGDDSLTPKYDYMLYHKSTGILQIYYGNNSSQDISTTAINDGTWKHIVVSLDNGTAKTYINSILDKTTSGITLTNNSYKLYLGALKNGASINYQYSGLIDEVRVYNRALNPTEVTALYEYAPGPIAYYNFEEGVGTSAYDQSGNNHNGILGTGTSAPNWTVGKYGKGLNFGGNDYIDFGPADWFNSLSNITISLWIKPNASQQQYTDILSAHSYGWNLEQYSTSNNLYYFSYWNGSSWQGGDIRTQLTADRWQHFVVQKDGTTIKHFINGIQNTTGSVSGDIVYSSGHRLYISRFSDSISRFFTGQLDDVKIYNYARTQKQILQDMSGRAGSASGGNALSSKTPIQYWKFDNSLISAVQSGSTSTTFQNVKPAYTMGKFGQALDFTRLYSGSVSYIDNYTLRDSTKNWATNELVGYQFYTDYNPGSQYCRSTITSNTATDIVFPDACNVFAGTKTYGIKKSIVTFAYIPNLPRNMVSASLWFKTNSSQSARITRMSNEAIHLSIAGNYVHVGAISYQNTVGYTTTDAYNNQWHYIAMTYDGSTQKIYYDGIFRNSSVLSGTLPACSGCYMNLGSRNDASNEFFHGQIDEVKVYNYALSDDEIKTDYNQGAQFVMGKSNQTIGGTTTSLDYCIPGDTSACSPPIAEYKFEEGTGTTAFDTSGNGYNGMLVSSPTWTIGKIGKGLSFVKESNQYVQIDPTKETNFDFTTAVTAEAWVNLSSNDSYAGIISKTESNTNGWEIRTRSANGNLECRILNGVDIGTTVTISLNQWHHLGCTYSTSDNLIKIFVDGQIGSTIAASNGIATNNNAVLINGLAYAGGLNTTGKIDQVKIYNYARTPAQIAYDYNGGKPIGWWKFDECEGTMINDWSGIGNTGALTIGPNGTQTTVGTCSIGDTSAWSNSATGKINSAMSFDNSDDYTNMGTSPVFSFGTGDMSVGAWVKGSNTFNYRNIVYHNYNPGWTLITDITTGVTRFWLGNRVTNGNKVIIDGTWHHVLVTRQNDYVNIYVDGKFDVQNNGYSGLNATTTEPLCVGQYCGSLLGSYPFNGLIDDVRIYNYALTVEQVKSVYNGGSVNFR